MNIKSFGISLAVVTILSLGLTGCIDSDDDKSNGANSTSLAWNNTGSEFVINTTINNTSDYYHVRHLIIDSDGAERLTEGANYTGTITTTCSKGLASGTYVEYTCITHRDTESPLGDPSDETNIVKLYDSKGYKVYLEEKSLSSSDKESEISSIVQP